MNIIQFFDIDQTISGGQCYAVSMTWFKQFEELLCESSQNIPQIDNYSICICQEENTQMTNVINTFKREFDISPQITRENCLEQIFKYKSQNAVIVNKQLWEYIVENFKGGPCVPVYALSKSECNVAKTAFTHLRFLSHQDVENLDESQLIPVDLIMMEFLIQNEDDTLIYLQKVVPQAFTIQQVITKILTPIFDCSNRKLYLPNIKKWLNYNSSQLVYEMDVKTLWLLKPLMQNLKTDEPIGFSQELDEVQMRHDFQNLKTGSTESTTESREFQSLLDISQQHQQSYNFEFDNGGNSSDLMLRDLDDFKNEIETALKNQKYQPLSLLKFEQAVENINQIISQLEQDTCLKKEQQEEGTNDELMEQDV